MTKYNNTFLLNMQPITRKQYALTVFGTFIGGALLMGFFSGMFGVEELGDDQMFILLTISAIVFVIQSMKRLTDIGWSRWLILLALIPFGFFVGALLLSIMPPKEEKKVAGSVSVIIPTNPVTRSNKPHNEGADAYRMNEELSDNPYEAATDYRHSEWAMGFITEQYNDMKAAKAISSMS